MYRPGKKNEVADVLSLYGVKGTIEATASAWYSLGDRSVRCVVYNWLNVVARRLSFDNCVAAAIEALSQ